jgi:hypothetical protein
MFRGGRTRLYAPIGMSGPDHELVGRPLLQSVRRLADPVLVPGLVLVALLWFLGVKAGGYDPTIWYPVGLVVVALVLLVVFAGLHRGRLPARVWLALATFAAYAAWVGASVAWAPGKAVAWDAANMTVLYLAIFVVVVSIRWRAATAAVTLGVLAFAVATTGVVELVRASAAADPSGAFAYGRFAAPLGYQNAACAWYLLAAWPLLRLASQRSAPVVVRTLAGAALAAIPSVALLCQSRASLVAAPVAAAVYLVLVPGRARTLVYLAVAAVPAAVFHSRLLHVFTAIETKIGVGAAVSSARNAVLVAALAGAVCSLALAVADRRLPLPRLRAGSRYAIFALAAAGVAAGVALAGVHLEHPEARLRKAWRDFKVTQPRTQTSYFAKGLGGNRYDIWRVAVDEFVRHPAAGIGGDNFQAQYLAHRATDLETPKYPHSLELRILSQTGVVGAVLFAAFLAACAAALRRVRRLPGDERAWSAVGIVVFAYWFVHGSVDWFWEIPALGGAAFLCLGTAAALQVGERLDFPRRPAFPPRARRAAQAGAALVSVAAAASFVFPWFAAENTVLAGRSWRQTPATAYARLHTAARLNPLSAQPYLVEGAIAARRGDRGRMIRAFGAALDRDPHEWFAEIELAVAQLAAGRTDLAAEHLARARRLNPHDPSLEIVGSALAAGRRLPLTALDSLFLQGI